MIVSLQDEAELKLGQELVCVMPSDWELQDLVQTAAQQAAKYVELKEAYKV